MTSVDGPTIAVIPARGGSKRIPRKNIREFAGVPMLTRTIQKLLQTEIFDNIFVSTDDSEIASVASAAGSSLLANRPAHLSDDHATTAEVITYELGRVISIVGATPRWICVVYPGAVLVSPQSIRAGLGQLISGDLDAVVSALPHPSPVWRAWQLDDDGTASMIWPENRTVRTQDLKPTYFDAGQFYWSKISYWPDQIDPKTADSARVGLQILRPWEAVDIDTSEDWDFAERLFRLMQ